MTDVSLYDLTDDERLVIFSGLSLAARTAEAAVGDHPDCHMTAMLWRTLAYKIGGQVVLEQT